MEIARKLRTQNITAYIIYMFQVEDVIRAYGLDAERIGEEYLPRFGFSAQELEAEKEWYGNLSRMMQEEGVREKGHVQVVRNTILLMADRHAELLQDPKQPFYSAAYYKALPYIVELRARSQAQDKNEIENCLDALYGTTVLKMQGRELTEETKKALQPITNLLEALNQKYNEESLSPALP